MNKLIMFRILRIFALRFLPHRREADEVWQGVNSPLTEGCHIGAVCSDNYPASLRSAPLPLPSLRGAKQSCFKLPRLPLFIGLFNKTKRIGLISLLVLFIFGCASRRTQSPPPKPVLPSEVLSSLSKMESAMKSLKSIKYTSHLTLTYKGRKLTKKEESKAEVYMQKPLLFRVDASQDGKGTVLFVCDGSQLFLYEYQTNRYSSFEPTPERIEKATGFSLLSFVLTQNFQQKLLVGIVSASLEKTPPNSPYTLISLKGKNGENILIYMDKKTSLPLKTQIIMQYASLEEEVSDLKLNPVIPSSTFTFKPPKGALRAGMRL
ncbi:MAG: DUF2092 domain-containing protein [bacterium]